MKGERIHISVVVPVYCSGSIIPVLVSRIISTLQSRKYTYEVILTDDNSIDNSWEVIKAECKRNEHIKGIRLSKNSGQMVTTLAGISKAKGDCIVTIDDDLEYNPEDILKLYDTFQSGQYYITFGLAKDKYLLKGNNPDISRLRNKIINLLLNKTVTDSFKIFKREVVFENERFIPDIHFEAFLKHNVNRKFISYTSVGYNPRLQGKSNYAFLKKVKLFFNIAFDYFKINFDLIIRILIILNLLFLSYLLLTKPLNKILFIIAGGILLLAIFAYRLMIKRKLNLEEIISEQVNQ